MPNVPQVPFLFPEGAKLGADNVVLHARARRHRVQNYAGPLSIKTVLTGRVAWVIGGRPLVVDPSSFLIIASGERYSMDIDSSTQVETCCAFFAPGFVERTVLDATSPVEQSLDLPERTAPAAPYLSAAHNDAERSLIGRVQGFADRCRETLKPSGWEEEFLVLAMEMFRFYREIREQAARIPAIRKSTKEELFRRLLIGREYMHSQLSGSVSLATVARTACLSPFHFHRAFSQAFGRTPHAYLTGIRLAHARTMIERGSLVVDACLEAGFASPAAFSRLFQSQYGERPSEVRRKFARSGKTQNRGSAIVEA
jgi:AraC family transcriptional regulator